MINKILFGCITIVLILLAVTLVCTASEHNISYEIKKAGAVSLGIYDKEGYLIRTLQSGKKQEIGTYQIIWDGKDSQGKDVNPGKYQLRGITSKIKAVYELVAGNPGNPPYKTSDGKGAWNGFWGNPMGLATDASGVYIQYSMQEGDGSLIKVDLAGNVQWKAHLFQGDGNGYQLAAASDGKYVYVAADVGDQGDLVGSQRKSLVWRVEAATGNFALWNNHGIVVGNPYQSGPVPFWEVVGGNKKTPPVAYGANVRGLAVRGDRLYVPLYRENKIEVYDTKEGKRTSVIEEIPKPQGVVVDREGNLYVASEKNVLKINTNGKVLGSVIDKELSAPYGVAVDVENNIYISDLGNSQQVKKFSSKGDLLWAAGKKGGRPFSGKMDNSSFLFPSGLAIDKTGNVYIGEDSPPCRVTVLNNKGEIVEEWIGTLGIGAGTGIAVDETEPSLVYALSVGVTYCGFINPLIRYKIDYDKKTWKVDAYWWGLAGSGSAPMRGGMSMASPRIIGWGQSEFYIRHFAGHTYLFSGQHWNHPIWKVEGYNMVASACVGQGDRWLPTDLDKGYTLDTSGNPAVRNSSRPFIWRDKNGDGEVSSDEVESFEEPKGLGGHGSWGGYIDYDMNVYLPDSVGTGNVYKVPCLGIDEKGNPIYSWTKAEIVVKAKDAILAGVDYARIGQPNRAGEICQFYVERIHMDKAKNIFGTVEIMGQDKGIGWASSTVDVKTGRWDSLGNLLWKTGEKAKGFAKPGEFYTGKGIDGVIKGFVFFTDENGQSRIYSEDGLYAGSVPASDPYRGIAFGPDALVVELCGARVFTEPKSGKDYYMAGDETGLHFWRLEGLTNIERMEVAVELK